ncbi:MAG: Fe-S cluster assembly sulfur transfer protein SufU [Verrucomicrobiota bacterium]
MKQDTQNQIDVAQLYQGILLDHSRSPRNFGLLTDAQQSVHGRHAKCGDEVTLHLIWSQNDLDPTLEKITFEGQGCAISQASASLMTELLRGKKKSQITNYHQAFKELLHADSSMQTTLSGEILALQSISQFPQRIPCAMLAWNALEQAIDRLHQTNTMK